MKVCCRCKINKPIDSFHRCSTRGDGLAALCKECKKIEKRTEYLKHKERYNSNAKARRERVGHDADYHKAYYEANREALLAQKADYIKRHPEQRSATSKRYRELREQRLLAGNVTEAQLVELYHRSEGKCFYCSSPVPNPKFHPIFHVGFDHRIALAKGGAHTIENLVVSCKPCNVSKNVNDAPRPRHG